MYAYCANNPVNLTDPSGSIALIDDAIFALGCLCILGIFVLAEAAVGVLTSTSSPYDGNAALNVQDGADDLPDNIVPFPKRSPNPGPEIAVVPRPAPENNHQERGGKYFEVMLCGQGSGIIVFGDRPLDFSTALSMVKDGGQDIWTPLQSDAIALLEATGRSYAGPFEDSPGDCRHYHFEYKGKNDVHVFFGFEGVMMFGGC